MKKLNIYNLLQECKVESDVEEKYKRIIPETKIPCNNCIVDLICRKACESLKKIVEDGSTITIKTPHDNLIVDRLSWLGTMVAEDNGRTWKLFSKKEI